MRFYGEVGYGIPVEVRKGVWQDQIVEKPLRGDVERAGRGLGADDQVNRDISLNHTVSVVADPYALAHYANIKYVKIDGVRWIVTSVTVRRPRLVLQTGGVFNGPAAVAGTP